MFTVYLATCISNGKVYVGQTHALLSKRKWAHLRRKDYDGFFHRAIRKYGEASFTWQTLGLVDSKEEANNLERLWIIVLRARNRSFGYNLTAGGDGSIGIKHSEETKRKRSESLKRAHAMGKFPYLGGWKRNHSDETRARISQSLIAHYELSNPPPHPAREM